MGWLMDLIIVAFMLLVIITNTKKGCKTILSLLVTAGAFAAAYFYGSDVGEYFMTDIVTEQAYDMIYDFLSSAIGETSETITVADLLDKLPESISAVLERVGADVEMLAESFGEMTIVSDSLLSEMADHLSVTVSRFIASALGCITVFIAALIALLIAKWLILLIIKLPVLRQASSLLGFFMGIVSAFAWSWIICIAIGAFIDYSLLGEYNTVLSEIAENSYIFKFFRDFTLVELLGAAN